LVLKGIIKGSSLSNKEELAMQLEQMSQPNPEQQQMQQMQQELQMRLVQAQVAKTEAEAQEAAANAQKAIVEAQMAPEETRAKVIASISKNLPNNDDAAQAEFDRRVKIAELMLKEADMKNKSKIVEMQMAEKMSSLANVETDFLDKLTERLNSDEQS
jgi:hypothetical protein